MASRDGVKFSRWNESFLRPGIERRRDAGTTGTSTSPGTSSRRSRAIEGAPESFRSMPARATGPARAAPCAATRCASTASSPSARPMSGGELVTKPLTFEGDRLRLNFSTSAASRRVELQDQGGRPIPGFTSRRLRRGLRRRTRPRGLLEGQRRRRHARRQAGPTSGHAAQRRPLRLAIWQGRGLSDRKAGRRRRNPHIIRQGRQESQSINQ